MPEVFANKRVLVVDDMKIGFLVLEELLKDHGFEVLYEDDCHNVLKIVEKIKPAIILLDFEMPTVNGPTLCKQLKSNINTQNIPVLFVTAHTDEDKLELAFESGADDYLLKPVREKELLARINRSLLNVYLQKELNIKYEEQTNLTRIISHDISNYLSVSLAALENIYESIKKQDTVVSAIVEKNYVRSRKSILRIKELIFNVRNMQLLEDHANNLKIEAVNLNSILEETMDVFAENILNKSIQVKVECPADLSVRADKNSLTISVINNLMSNAIKFTHVNGQISLMAKAVGDKVALTIKDNGIGMNAKMLAKIFSKTEKISRAGTQNESGTGFGLPIVKSCMNLYGGSVIVESKSVEEYPNECGTSFYLEFLRA